MRQCVSGCVFFNRLDSNFGGAAVGEAELAGGDAAEGYRVAAVHFGKAQTSAVACRQLLLLQGGRDAVGYNRAYSVDDILAWQVVAGRNDGFAGSYHAALKGIVALLP